MTAGPKTREWLYCMLLIGVKGHAGMSPRQNFGRGWGKPKRVLVLVDTQQSSQRSITLRSISRQQISPKIL